MSEEYLVILLLNFVKSLERVSVTKVREYVNNVLLARAGGMATTCFSRVKEGGVS